MAIGQIFCLIYFLRQPVGAAGVSFLEWVEIGLCV